MSFTIERIYIPSIELSNAMNAVADKEVTRDDMASFYEDCIHCSNVHGMASIDWKTLNAAILTRWPKGLNYIKKNAWKMAESRYRKAK